MSSQEYHQLLEAVKALSIIARRAYWQGYYSHCGHPVRDDCALCHSYEVCRAEKALDTAIAMIGAEEYTYGLRCEKCGGINLVEGSDAKETYPYRFTSRQGKRRKQVG